MARFLAIDADAGGLFVAAGFARGGTVRLEQAVAVPGDPRPLSAATAPELAGRLKQALADARIAAAPVLLCLGRDRVIFKDVKHPKSAPADEPAVVRFQAQRDLTEPPDDVHMDYVPAAGGTDDERRATVVFVRKDLYAAAKTLCEAAGLKLAGVTPRPFAAAAAARNAIAAAAVPPPDDPAAPVATLSVWDGGGEFVVAAADRLLFSRTVPASALGGEAALVGEVKRALAGYAAQHPGAAVQAVYLSEGHSTGGRWAARLQSAVPLPVYPFDPLTGPAADHVPAAVRGRFLGPVGLLALKAAAGLPINFVAPRQPRAEPSKVRARLLLGLVLLLAVGGAVAAGATMLHTDLDRKIAAQTLRKKDADDDLKAQQTDTNRLAAVDDFRSRDVVWLDVLYDLYVLHPDIDKLRLEEFEAKVEPPKPEARKPGAALANRPAGGPAGAAVKPVAKKEVPPPGKLTLKFLGTDYQLPEQVKQVLANDPAAYQNPTLEGFGQAGGRSEALKFELKADVLKRKPADYTRKLDAKFPAVVAAPVAPPADEDSQ